MTHYVAIVEEEEGKATGVWFPDLPGCVSAGDTLDEAMQNAAEALGLWAQAIIESGQTIPPARRLADLKADREVAQDLGRYMVALIPLPESLRQYAAE
jgi:predicted RNase H-like HicB family nuclease